MAETFYVDVKETDNVECKLDGMAELVSNAVAPIDANALCVSTTASVLTFSIEGEGADRTFRISGAGATDFVDILVGMKVIVRGSVQAATGTHGTDYVAAVENDGCYTVTVREGAGKYIEVAEPVKDAVSDEAANTDEYATFILHPTKPTGQMLTFIEITANCAELYVSFEPGGYWASKIETGLPVMQGEETALSAIHMYLVQIETAPYLQTEENLDANGDAVPLAVDADADNDVDKKGTILMRVFGAKDDPLTAAEVKVAYIMIA